MVAKLQLLQISERFLSDELLKVWIELNYLHRIFKALSCQIQALPFSYLVKSI